VGAVSALDRWLRWLLWAAVTLIIDRAALGDKRVPAVGLCAHASTHWMNAMTCVQTAMCVRSPVGSLAIHSGRLYA
jgi:hypothetical protein